MLTWAPSDLIQIILLSIYCSKLRTIFWSLSIYLSSYIAISQSLSLSHPPPPTKLLRSYGHWTLPVFISHSLSVSLIFIPLLWTVSPCFWLDGFVWLHSTRSGISALLIVLKLYFMIIKRSLIFTITVRIMVIILDGYWEIVAHVGAIFVIWSVQGIWLDQKQSRSGFFLRLDPVSFIRVQHVLSYPII